MGSCAFTGQHNGDQHVPMRIFQKTMAVGANGRHSALCEDEAEERPPDSKNPGGVRSRLARIRLAGVKKPAEITR